MDMDILKWRRGCKVSFVKIPWLIVVKEVTNTMIFKVFEYGAGYVADYSADSDEIVSH